MAWNRNRERSVQTSIRANHRIKAREVYVIDDEGKPLGVLSISEAMAAARRRGMDLVEVSPNRQPPVCKILDFGKYRYELAKKEKDNKKSSNATKVKELKFHINIDEHDYHVKMKHAEAFMWKGMKTKLVIGFRGREIIHQDIGVKLMARIRADLLHIGTADAEPKLIGRNIIMMLTPHPIRKRERKFTHEDDAELEDTEDDSDTEGEGEDDEGDETTTEQVTEPKAG